MWAEIIQRVRGESCSLGALGNQRRQQVSKCMGHLIAQRMAHRIQDLEWRRNIRRGQPGGDRTQSSKWPTNDKVQRQSTSLVFISCRSVKRTRQTAQKKITKNKDTKKKSLLAKNAEIYESPQGGWGGKKGCRTHSFQAGDPMKNCFISGQRLPTYLWLPASLLLLNSARNLL